MPNLINQLSHRELKQAMDSMGSCLIVGFDKLTVEQDQTMRTRFAGSGLDYRVIKNRIARLVFQERSLDPSEVFRGKCGIVLAPHEDAIAAAKLVRSLVQEKTLALEIRAGVIEGDLLVGAAAAAIADMPDRQAVRAMIAQAVIGPARKLAMALNQVGAGMARGLKARSEQAPA